MIRQNNEAYAYDFDKTILYAYGDSDEYRKLHYGKLPQVQAEWYRDINNYYKGTPLHCLKELQHHIDNMDDVYVISARGTSDTRVGDTSQKLITRYLNEYQNIYIPEDKIICLAIRGASIAARKVEVIKKLIDHNDYLYFEYHDDRPTTTAFVNSINGYNNCIVKGILETDWTKFSATQYDER